MDPLIYKLVAAAFAAAFFASSSHAAPRAQSGKPFAEELFSACMSSGGNMDTILGRSL